MGFELEQHAYARHGVAASSADERLESVMRRWLAADERLTLAQARYRALRGHVSSDDIRMIAAQLNLAQARHRRQELDEEFARLRFVLSHPDD